jgi:hypothetical protein
MEKRMNAETGRHIFYAQTAKGFALYNTRGLQDPCSDQPRNAPVKFNIEFEDAAKRCIIISRGHRGLTNLTSEPQYPPERIDISPPPRMSMYMSPATT